MFCHSQTKNIVGPVLFTHWCFFLSKSILVFIEIFRKLGSVFESDCLEYDIFSENVSTVAVCIDRVIHLILTFFMWVKVE